MADRNLSKGFLNIGNVSVSFPDHPELNVTPGYLGKDMINIAQEGELTHFIPVATGEVLAPQLQTTYVITMRILKTLPLHQAFVDQIDQNTVLGTATVRGDATSVVYNLQNVGIRNDDPGPQNGTQAETTIVIRGTKAINSALNII